MNGDEKISRRYRELPREEPPRRLDDAILAAARRAVHTRPAPLVVPTGRQRWYFPLAAAAIIVLAVAVTVHVEREQPAEEIVSAAPQSTAPAPAAPSARESMREEAKPPAEKPKPAPQPERRRKAESADANLLRDKPAAAAPPAELQKAPEPSAPAPSQDAAASAAQAYGRVMRRDLAESEIAIAPQAAPAPQPQAAPRPPSSVRAVIEPQAGATTLSASAMRAPEQWLQGIADLRRQRRHEEADRELAEFRKRYPDYRIPPEMRKQVEKR